MLEVRYLLTLDIFIPIMFDPRVLLLDLLLNLLVPHTSPQIALSKPLFDRVHLQLDLLVRFDLLGA